MKLLQFDSLGGASGDMILGALFELGVDPARLQRALESLAPGGFEMQCRRYSSHNLHGAQVTVVAPERDAHGHAHPDRRIHDIRVLIETSKLPERVKTMSTQVFARIAEAEAEVHGLKPEEIHFHEVGALDSIVDIVGACLALEWLEVDAVVVRPLPLGSGTIECAHGIYPTPAPATVALLKGFPTVQTTEPYELVTPTGAALLTVWHSRDLPPRGSRIERVGYSFGHRQLDARPNVIRAMLLRAEEATGESDECVVLECNVDDTVPELMGHLVEQLLASGALDAYTTPVQMKKQRPGTLLTVLCRPERTEALKALVFSECTTFGIRGYTVDRTTLVRRHDTVRTPYGEVRIKIGSLRGQDLTFAPEMDDCVARAGEHRASVRRVYEAALQAAQALRG